MSDVYEAPKLEIIGLVSELTLASGSAGSSSG